VARTRRRTVVRAATRGGEAAEEVAAVATVVAAGTEEVIAAAEEIEERVTEAAAETEMVTAVAGEGRGGSTMTGSSMRTGATTGHVEVEAEEEGTGVAEVVEAVAARTASENKLRGEFLFLYQNQIA